MFAHSLPSIVVILTALIAGGILLFYKPLISSSSWRAVITPLASIMGSGFLVCAPLLYANIGNYAVLAMAGLLILAYAIGSVIRFNIQYGEALFERHNGLVTHERKDHRLHIAHKNASHRVGAGELTEFLEKTSHIVLAGSYCVSVSYYLQLLASFALQPLSLDMTWHGKALVTIILTGIGIIGAVRGLKGIERVEQVAVGFNMAMIAALLMGLIYYNIHAMSHGTWHLNHNAVSESKVHVVRLLMGMLIIVQGFETSRFIGSEHSREERIKTMRLAQLVSSGIYVLFILLMAVVIAHPGGGDKTGITAIIGFSSIVAPILPILLTITAIGSQFSAATADDAGCSGLMESILEQRVSAGFGYIIVSIVAIALTWLTDVYQIINYASRAFALFYALQCMVGILVIRKVPLVRYPGIKTFMYGILVFICLLVTIFGIPAG